MLNHGEVADLGDTSAFLKLIFDSRTNSIIARVGFEHYIQDVGTVRGEGQIVNKAACDDDPSLTSYISGELELDAFPGALATVAATKFCYNDEERTWQFIATATNFSFPFGKDHILTMDSVKLEVGRCTLSNPIKPTLKPTVHPIKPTVHPIKPTLKLKYDEFLSNFAFKFNVRRYIEALGYKDPDAGAGAEEATAVLSLELDANFSGVIPGTVGPRCRSTLSNPR
jgi:hypothetical protein